MEAAVLNSGSTNTVAGESWLNCYKSSLNENEKQKVQCHPVKNTKRFSVANSAKCKMQIAKCIYINNIGK